MSKPAWAAADQTGAMPRVARRMYFEQQSGPPRFDPDQPYVESAPRGRAARKVRAHLRRAEAVVVLTPRWSEPQRFFDDLALDLAVGEPAIGCRAVSLRPVVGRTLGEAWQFTLHVFTQLGRGDWHSERPASVADRRGFRWALGELIERAHRESSRPVALLAHGAEHLPVEILEDIATVWCSYVDAHPDGRRCALLLAGAAGAMRVDWLRLAHAPRILLADLGEAEAAAAIVSRAGPLPYRQLERVARFTGGVPGLVYAVGDVIRRLGQVPLYRDELLQSTGTMADEIRGAVDIVAADGALADRLQALRSCEARPYEPALDPPLLSAGLVREVRGPGGGWDVRLGQEAGEGPARVALRAPAIAALLD